MGGSGGGGSYPSGGAGSGRKPTGGGGGGAGGEEGSDCHFEFTTTIFGPVPHLVASLSVGSVLDVMLAGRTLNLHDPSQRNQIVGTLAGATQIPSLVACINAGISYNATVTQVTGSRIVVKVKYI